MSLIFQENPVLMQSLDDFFKEVIDICSDNKSQDNFYIDTKRLIYENNPHFFAYMTFLTCDDDVLISVLSERINGVYQQTFFSNHPWINELYNNYFPLKGLVKKVS